jgi:hypothetical protein
MGKAKFALTAVFLLAVASGLVAGVLMGRLPVAGSVQAAARSPLAQELQLTTEQNEAMRQIWEGIRQDVDDCFLQAQTSQKARDEALFALLTDEQKVKFAKVQNDCARELASLKAQRDAAFQDAVLRTERILSESQRQRYRQILQARLGQDAGSGPDWLQPQTPTTMPQHGQ